MAFTDSSVGKIKTMTTHTLPIRVYYEDTDADGIVYHGAYIYMAERGRTEFLRSEGTSIRAVNENLDMTFVVRALTIEYSKPAVLDDLLTLKTHVKTIKNSSFVMQQDFYRGDDLMASVDVTLVCVSADGIKPVRMPEELRKIFKNGE